MTFLIALDGVMRSGVMAPIPAGIELYNALSRASRTVVLADTSVADAEHWMRSHGVKLPDRTIGGEVSLSGVDLRTRQLELESSSPVRLVVEADPQRALTLVSQGAAVLLFSQDAYLPPSMQFSAQHAKSWAEIQDAVEARRLNSQESELY